MDHVTKHVNLSTCLKMKHLYKYHKHNTKGQRKANRIPNDIQSWKSALKNSSTCPASNTLELEGEKKTLTLGGSKNSAMKIHYFKFTLFAAKLPSYHCKDLGSDQLILLLGIG